MIGVDLVPERLERVRARGVETVDLTDHEDDLAETIRGLTGGRGPGRRDRRRRHGGARLARAPASPTSSPALLPDAIAEPFMQKAGVDKLAALHSAIDIVRRGGTISLSGVYGGMADPMPMLTIFDKQIQLRMGQANVLRWVDDILPLLTDEDPLGVDTFATHHVPLTEAPQAYETFQKKQDGAVKVVFRP